jgi:hypothetical protein
MLPGVNHPRTPHFFNRLSHFRELRLKRPDVEVTSPVLGQSPFDLSSPTLQRIPTFADRRVGRGCFAVVGRRSSLDRPNSSADFIRDPAPAAGFSHLMKVFQPAYSGRSEGVKTDPHSAHGLDYDERT